MIGDRRLEAGVYEHIVKYVQGYPVILDNERCSA